MFGFGTDANEQRLPKGTAAAPQASKTRAATHARRRSAPSPPVALQHVWPRSTSTPSHVGATSTPSGIV